MSPNKLAQRRYVTRLLSVMAVYVLAILAGVTMKAQGLLNPQTTALVALIPGLCIVLVFWAMGRLIVELKDEFMRMLIVRQVLIATAFAFSLAAIHGFLSSFDVIEKVDAFYWPVTFFFGLFIGMVANRIKFGTWGSCA